MKLFKSVVAAAVLTLATISFSVAGEYKHGDLVIDHLYARATPPNAQVSGGYMVITNNGSEDDRLVGASVDFAGKVEVHEMKMEDDIMKMREVENGLVIPSGESVTLKPGGFHVMFMKLEEQLKEGESRKAVLVFENAGEIEVEFSVGSIAAGQKKTGHGDHSHD